MSRLFEVFPDYLLSNLRKGGYTRNFSFEIYEIVLSRILEIKVY